MHTVTDMVDSVPRTGRVHVQRTQERLYTAGGIAPRVVPRVYSRRVASQVSLIAGGVAP